MKLTSNNLAEIMAFKMGMSAYNKRDLNKIQTLDQVFWGDLYPAWSLGYRYAYVMNKLESN